MRYQIVFTCTFILTYICVCVKLHTHTSSMKKKNDHTDKEGGRIIYIDFEFE